MEALVVLPDRLHAVSKVPYYDFNYSLRCDLSLKLVIVQGHRSGSVVQGQALNFEFTKL